VFIPHEVFIPQKYVHSSTQRGGMYTLPHGGVQRGGTPSAGFGGAILPTRGSSRKQGFGGEAPEAKIAL
jgi:hypothetical protein